MFRIASCALLATLCASPVHAQSDEDSIFIAGTSAEVCTVDAGLSQATIILSSRAPQDLSGVIYTCNAAGGFTRTISSQNGGRLVRGDQSIPYTIMHSGESGLAIASSIPSAPLISTVPGSQALSLGAEGMLRARIANVPENLLAGEYSDTLTIAITSN